MINHAKENRKQDIDCPLCRKPSDIDMKYQISLHIQRMVQLYRRDERKNQMNHGKEHQLIDLNNNQKNTDDIVGFNQT